MSAGVGANTHCRLPVGAAAHAELLLTIVLAQSAVAANGFLQRNVTMRAGFLFSCVFFTIRRWQTLPHPPQLAAITPVFSFV